MSKKEKINYAKVLSRISNGLSFKTVYECQSCKTTLAFGYDVYYCHKCGKKIEFDDEDYSRINKKIYE